MSIDDYQNLKVGDIVEFVPMPCHKKASRYVGQLLVLVERNERGVNHEFATTRGVFVEAICPKGIKCICRDKKRLALIRLRQ